MAPSSQTLATTQSHDQTSLLLRKPTERELGEVVHLFGWVVALGFGALDLKRKLSKHLGCSRRA